MSDTPIFDELQRKLGRLYSADVTPMPVVRRYTWMTRISFPTLEFLNNSDTIET